MPGAVAGRGVRSQATNASPRARCGGALGRGGAAGGRAGEAASFGAGAGRGTGSESALSGSCVPSVSMYSLPLDQHVIMTVTSI